MSSSLPPIDPFDGKPRPTVGRIVYIDFGDSFGAHPELMGTVTGITDNIIEVNGETFSLDDCMFIETLEA